MRHQWFCLPHRVHMASVMNQGQIQVGPSHQVWTNVLETKKEELFVGAGQLRMCSFMSRLQTAVICIKYIWCMFLINIELVFIAIAFDFMGEWFRSAVSTASSKLLIWRSLSLNLMLLFTLMLILIVVSCQNNGSIPGILIPRITDYVSSWMQKLTYIHTVNVLPCRPVCQLTSPMHDHLRFVNSLHHLRHSSGSLKPSQMETFSCFFELPGTYQCVYSNFSRSWLGLAMVLKSTPELCFFVKTVQKWNLNF